MLELYTYFRSSAAFRVRIALELKALPWRSIPVHLLRSGGEQHAAQFVELNPAHLVPVLKDQALTFTQSLAIIEYLEERHPQPPLLPQEPAARAHVRALALGIACDIHPINNLRVLRYLGSELGAAEPQRQAWSAHWIGLGFTALERMLAASGADAFCYGSGPTLADCCLVPQVFNALRLKLTLNDYPIIGRIYENCMGLPAFVRAAPAAQSDAE